ncbi:MFS transporter [Variovorax sp. J22R115]|uniref:MFS transporter n=1 Tax=Variovorax sp. J22R115 TaxID=3053509 RepID=UPI002575FC9D|nr:MFS transporter [Variovorax sp. J22R115]MDM0049734.1 MFS transporter [Variovorax sp. J22R115]
MIFWIASIAVFLVSLDSTILFAACAAIGASFPGTSAADMSWVLNAYTVEYAAALIPAGGLADAHGRKRIFLLGVSPLSRGIDCLWAAGNVGWLVAARILQAVGAALLTPASLSIAAVKVATRVTPTRDAKRPPDRMLQGLSDKYWGWMSARRMERELRREMQNQAAALAR